MPPQQSEEIEQHVFKDEVIEEKRSMQGKISAAIARNPWKCLAGALVFTFLFSAIGIIGGDFKIEVDNKGWRSRGTLIANREMQNDLVARLRKNLFEDTDGSEWDYVENTVQRGFLDIEDREDGLTRRNLWIDGCDPAKFYGNMLSKNNLFAVYKTKTSILEPDVLFEICETETETHKILEENGVCHGCDDENQCLPPFSLLLVLRLSLNMLDSSCTELRAAYTQDVQDNFTNTLVECTQEILANYDSTTQSYGTTTKCPAGFEVNLVDTAFGIDGNKELKHSSSYFITYKIDGTDLYDLRPQYALTDESLVTSVYDTLRQTQNEIYVDSVLLADMSLAVGSLTITFLAIGLHTKSFWLTIMGIFQIFFSVPLAYFVYYFIAGISFFPFLNFIGVFVAAALGADYVFVTVDKWKNARIENQSASTEDIAALALPNAASAMFLTTSTTAVAFFATTICPVTPILCFALFCGLLIVFNYVMNMMLLFPALCLYDIWLMNGSRNVLVNCGCCSKSIFEDRGLEKEFTESGEVKENMSFIHRVLSFFYNFMHKLRYGVLVACLIATAVCIFVALTIRLPDSVDVRLLPEDNPFELHFSWSKSLLSFLLFYSGGSNGEISWGLVAADTGVRNDPDSLTTLELDETFDPTSEDAQSYLLGFCEKLFATGLSSPLNDEYQCPINEFNDWLVEQSESDNPDAAYSVCNNATGLPIPQEDFNQCIVAWSEVAVNYNVLEKRGVLAILRTRVKNSVGWDAPFSQMDEFWKSYEAFLKNERAIAPEGVNKMFHTSGAFWWYDTNISMLQTAIGAAGIAIGFSTIVVLLASRSFILTLFSAICITYVLAATTSSLVGFGWDLGFLESICFAILIGISCDFVIHFGHAYNYLPGNTSRFERTKYAVIHMGPSILAAAFTTFAAATVMLFCKVTFFTKFALILLMTILHATLGSFVVYIVLADSFGPSEPTKFIDSIFYKLKRMCVTEKEDIPKLASKDVPEDEKKEVIQYDLSQP